MASVIRLLAFCAVVGFVSCRPTIPSGKNLKYLETYGYLEDSRGSARTPEDVIEALKNLQSFANIPVTGQLDDKTKKLLETDRCGMKDNYTRTTNGSIRVGNSLIGEYRLQGTYWKKKDLTYRIRSYTSDLNQELQRRIFRAAFDHWQAATDLTITDVTFDDSIPHDDVDILISFERRRHHDSYPFDGPGGTLAHAFYPLNNEGLSGDAHFDDDERFTTGKNDGINLDWVAVHEFGHSLGLHHSGVRESIMYPWYKGFLPNIKLTYDDIQGIQALYGRPRPNPTNAPSSPTTQATTEKRTTIRTEETETTERSTEKPTTERSTEKPTTTQPDKPLPDNCKLLSYDTFFNGLDGKTYAVSGAYYWIIKQRTAGTESGPHKLADKFPGLLSPVDTAFSKGGKTFFFRGSRYWQYSYSNGIFVAQQNNRPMSEIGLPSALHDMDAAFVYRNGKTYFLKGTQYWRYNDNFKRIDSGYPRKISRGWTGVQGEFDDALTWKSNGKTYFFKGENYIRIHPTHHRLDSGYPQNTALKWMKCDPLTLGRLMIGSLSSTVDEP